MTREEFITLLEEELGLLEDAVAEEEERDYQVESFYEAYSLPSAVACSNLLYAVSKHNDDDSDDNRKMEWSGTNLLITHLRESRGFDFDSYIISLVNMETTSDEKILLMSRDEVIKYAADKWFDVHYQKDKEYEWYYKDSEYWEAIIND